MRAGRLAALGSFLLSCGSEDNLRTPTLTPSSDPTVLVTINEQVGALEADESRLYWMGTAENGRPGSAALRSCLKRDCSATLVTYDGSGAISSARFGVVNGEVFWFHLIDDEPFEWALSACPVDGCAASPRRVAHEVTPPPWRAAFTSSAVYLLDGSLFRIPLPAGGEPQFVAAPRGDAESFIAQGEHLYWRLSSYTATGSIWKTELQRAPTDGSAPPETLTDEISPAWSPVVPGLWFPTKDIALSSTHVYWSQGQETSGSIARCPLAGCDGAPEILGETTAPPGALKLDAINVYWHFETTASGIGVSQCPIDECTPSQPIAEGVDALDALAVDDDYIYTATGNLVADDEGRLLNPTAQIRRFPKERP